MDVSLVEQYLSGLEEPLAPDTLPIDQQATGRAIERKCR